MCVKHRVSLSLQLPLSLGWMFICIINLLLRLEISLVFSFLVTWEILLMPLSRFPWGWKEVRCSFCNISILRTTKQPKYMLWGSPGNFIRKLVFFFIFIICVDWFHIINTGVNSSCLFILCSCHCLLVFSEVGLIGGYVVIVMGPLKNVIWDAYD